MLSIFVAGEKDFSAEIRAALVRGDITAAIHHAHTLKGVAGQIAAHPLSAAAAKLENTLQQGAAQQETAARIDEVETQLGRLIAGLAPHLPATAPEMAIAPGEREQFHALSAQLQQLLAESDYASLELAERQAGLLRAGLGERYEKLLAAIGNFDFDQASAYLRTPRERP